jgi:hypothetical protein
VQPIPFRHFSTTGPSVPSYRKKARYSLKGLLKKKLSIARRLHGLIRDKACFMNR